MSVIESIQKFVPNDTQLGRLFEKVRENAELYLMAKQRQKGCDEMGEVATLKDEFIYSMDGIIRYSKEKGYLTDGVSYDADLIAHDICKIQPE